ncbi:hypothetical protein Glove_231g3 [Diversispora epigaea]|uniref:Uncharacterized protein n=1 Tax=Diversispora epigaea TaxID=1348612 RepID=A0A397IF15_9GLOM|nr:hypothetical protein Glove_231g3 [Diversispora epigaea]
MKKKLFGQCAACNLEKPEERYRNISNYALEKALTGIAYEIHCPEIKVGTLFCNRCYCAIVEHNNYKKYKNNNKKRKYQRLVNNSKSVEELKIEIQELKGQLEIATKPMSPDNNTFIKYFNDKIQRLTTVLYNYQHREGNKPVLDADEFVTLIENRDPNLRDFFNLIYQSMNPNAKGWKTKESLKQKVMLLCYQMAALRNKQVSGTKNVIGLYMAGTGTSTVGINTLSNMGLSATYQTVYNNKKQIVNVYEQTIQEYISDNQQKLLIFNIDDYHDLHESRIPSVTSINRISHMATILLNTNNILPIPLSSTFHNPNGIDANLLKQALNFQYMTGFSNSYNAQKFNWISIKDVTTLNEFDLVETLVVHCYDADLSEKHVRRFDTTKLVDFILSDLKNMNDYIKVLIKVFRLSEMQSYLMNYIIPIPADFPGQLYIRRAIVQKLKYGNQCSIPKEVLSLVPILGPLHVSLNTREISGTKNVIGLYMAGTGTSTVGINTLSNMGLSATYQTVYNNKKQIVNVYEQTIQEYISDNQQKLLIFNIDDYHDLHESRIPSVTSINRISHMATILLNTNNILPIPLSSTFHNPNGIDANLLKQVLNFQYMTGFSNSYNAQKFNWISIKDVTTLNEFDLVETLVVHCYDADLSEKHVRRFDTTKLVDFILSDLKNMNDYIKVLIKVFRLSEMQSYLMNYIIPIPADFPGQLYIRRAIVQKLKYGNQCSIPKEVLSLVPILGPLHVSLNTRETAKPKPWRINLLLYLAHAGWSTIKSYIFARFKYSKDLGYCTFVDLLDNLIPATLDIYTILFRENNFDQYIETIFRLWTVMRRFGRKNYDKIMLALISDIQY